MSVSILIPTHDSRSDAFRRTLTGALLQGPAAGQDIEVVAADTSPPERCITYSRSVVDVGLLDQPPDRLCYQHIHRDIGFLGAWRLCVDLARGDYLWWALDDWADPDWLSRAVPLMADDVSVVLCQSLVHFPDGREAPNLPGFPAHDQAVTSESVLSALFALSMTLTPACMLMRRDVAVDSFHAGRIPNAPRRTSCNDTYMVASAIASRPHVQWIAAPLIHLNADGGFTNSHMDDAHKAADLGAQYAEVKAAWKRHHAR